ncbi:extracellular solute-binding protein [Paenibacillus sp. IITD108]|uniref:extracellular solute-binding protein n=1 Tax=Paenibacillus sp. IITD108 TaxID=3116649 RepID=UPI002F3FB38A
MSFKKKAISAAAMIMSVCMLAACSSNSNNGPASPSPSTAPSNTASQGNATDASSKKFTITSIDYRYAGNVPAVDGKGISMINEKFNIDFQPQIVVVTDYLQKLSAVVASNELPDIITLENHQDANYVKWAKQGAFLPLDEYMDQYESFKMIPEDIRKSVMVDGKMYGIPRYSPENYSLTPMIRRDWLDNLNLKMPTTYEELKEVALAFTFNDPDKNGQNDTYGLAMSSNINPPYSMGAYYDFLAWYHKDEEGNYVPGIITDVRKELLMWIADIYNQGAATPDFAVLNWGQTNNEFYGSKAGIFIGTPRGMSDTNSQALSDIAPGAVLEPIPPFAAPDGSQGYTSGPGFSGITLINAKLAKEPEKLQRIFEFLDFGRQFYTSDQKNSSNADFDWMHGNEGSGYTIEDGQLKLESGELGLKPRDYYPDSNGWAPSDEANEYSSTYKVPILKEAAKKFEEMHASTQHYFNPVNAVFSEVRLAKEAELWKYMYDEQTKMIYGQRPFSDWDKLVEEWKSRGGAEMIKEVNDAIKAAGIQGYMK